MDDFFQRYPTYKFTERDVVLEELRNAYTVVNNSTLYSQLLNVLVGILSITFPILLHAKTDSQLISNATSGSQLLFGIVFFVIGAIVLKLFTELQKSIVFASKKVVVLRRMLGMDYGNLQGALPNWRYEGATSPFAIKLFPGRFNIVTMPLWLMLMFINIICYFLSKALSGLPFEWYYVNLLLSLLYMTLFRNWLNDLHETAFLHFTKVFAFILRIELLKDFEYILYNSKLSTHETKRLKYDITIFREYLTFVEDKTFFKHSGVVLTSLIRAFLSNFSLFRKKYGWIRSGGSTLHMQLVRSLFIPSNQGTFRRKLIEMLLAKWINRQFTKNEILEMYLSSVRFETGVIGLPSASRHFFQDDKKREFSHEEALFLVERLSNIRSIGNRERVHFLARSINDNIGNHIDLDALDPLYNSMVADGILKSYS